MRAIGKLQPTANARVQSDTVAVVVVAAAGTVTVADYPNGTRFVKIDTDAPAIVNLSSTAAHLPAASITATTSSSGLLELVNPAQDKVWQVASSTGYSVTANTTAIVTVSFYGAP